MEQEVTPAETLPQKAKGPSYTIEELRQAQDSLSIITTLLLSPGDRGFKTGMTFYAHFLMRMNIVWTDRIERAGVSITDKVNLYINPKFWNSLEPFPQMELLEHEIKHVVFMHPLRAKDYIDTSKNAKGRHKCANIAMDAPINEDLHHLMKVSEGFITFARLNKQLKEIKSKYQVDPKDPWEINYEKLMQAAKDNSDQSGDGEGFGDPVDDHDIWDESTSSKEVAEGIIRDTANKAQAATGVGNMPSEMLREIANMNKPSVNWRRELRQFFTSALNYEFEGTRKRRNRRYGLLQPGRKKKPQLNVAICVDSSGSVSDASFSQFFAEIAEISTMGVEITIIDADCQVQSVYKYDKKKAPQRTGNGGTAYSPAINKAKELGVDGIIYFGDMDSADHPENPGVPFLWAVVGSQNPPGNFGRTIRVIEENRQ